ncbi:unnamed protein product [Amoebophrya sp. A120]|nr:unnamed protein product [Amoebophrya sp. A120]|eukprot:GSA120T00006079001.1
MQGHQENLGFPGFVQQHDIHPGNYPPKKDGSYINDKKDEGPDWAKKFEDDKKLSKASEWKLKMGDKAGDMVGEKKKAQKTAWAGYKFGNNQNNQFAGGFVIGIEEKKGGDKYSVMNKAKKSGGHLLEKKNMGKNRISQIKDSTLSGITKPAIRRLARRGGVKRISKPIYDEIRSELRIFLESTLRDATTYCEHAKRKTVKPLDIVYALKRKGRDLYGYGM